jgi:hypothetical protein
LIALIGSIGPVQPSTVTWEIGDIGRGTSQMKGHTLPADRNAGELVGRCCVEPSTKPAGSSNAAIGQTSLPTSEVREMAAVEHWVTDPSNNSDVTSSKARGKPSQARMEVLTLTGAVRPGKVDGHPPAEISIRSASEWTERVDAVVSSTQGNGDEDRVVARRSSASLAGEQCGASCDRTACGECTLEKPSPFHQRHRTFWVEFSDHAHCTSGMNMPTANGS